MQLSWLLLAQGLREAAIQVSGGTADTSTLPIWLVAERLKPLLAAGQSQFSARGPLHRAALTRRLASMSVRTEPKTEARVFWGPDLRCGISSLPP